MLSLWSPIVPRTAIFPSARYGHTLVGTDTHLYVFSFAFPVVFTIFQWRSFLCRYTFGGMLKTGAACNELWSFVHSSQLWVQIKPILAGALWPAERYAHTMGVFPVFVTQQILALFQRYADNIAQTVTSALQNVNNVTASSAISVLTSNAYSSTRKRGNVDDISHFLAVHSGLNVDQADVLPDIWLFDVLSGLWTMPFTFAINAYAAIYPFGRRFSSMIIK